MSSHAYHGWRNTDGVALACGIEADGSHGLLPMRLDLDNHSPTGFEWGYGGSGPAQLALAILADALEDDELAITLHQEFKRRVIAGLARNAEWTITAERVRDEVATIIYRESLEPPRDRRRDADPNAHMRIDASDFE